MPNSPYVLGLSAVCAANAVGWLEPAARQEFPVVMVSIALCANAALAMILILRLGKFSADQVFGTRLTRACFAAALIGLFAVAHVIWLTPSTGVEQPNAILAAALGLRQPHVLVTGFLAVWLCSEWVGFRVRSREVA